MRSVGEFEHNYWLIEALEESRRVAADWNLVVLERKLDCLVKSAIIVLVASRPITSYPVALRSLVFVLLNATGRTPATPSKYFRSPQHEVLSCLSDLAEICRELGENDLASEIQEVVDLDGSANEGNRIPLKTEGNVVRVLGLQGAPKKTKPQPIKLVPAD